MCVFMCVSYVCNVYMYTHVHTQSNPDIALLFVNNILWRYIEGGAISKYCVNRDFLFTDFHGRQFTVALYQEEMCVCMCVRAYKYVCVCMYVCMLTCKLWQHPAVFASLQISPCSTCLDQNQHHFLSGLIKNVPKHEFIKRSVCSFYSLK